MPSRISITALWCYWVLSVPSVIAFVAVPSRPTTSYTTSTSSLCETLKHLTHSDIEWKLRPPEGTSRFDRLKIKVEANILRLDSKLKGNELPPVLCPRGGRAMLEAYYKGE